DDRENRRQFASRSSRRVSDLRTYGVRENERTDAGTSDPPPCAQPERIAETGRSNGGTGADIGGEKRCRNQARPEPPPATRKSSTFLTRREMKSTDSDEQCG